MDKFLTELAVKWNDGLAMYIDTASADAEGLSDFRVVPRYPHSVTQWDSSEGVGGQIRLSDILVAGTINATLLRQRVEEALAQAPK